MLEEEWEMEEERSLHKYLKNQKLSFRWKEEDNISSFPGENTEIMSTEATTKEQSEAVYYKQAQLF